ncbi:hypothetical protein Tco_1350477, partial [Tanacetum coccineum]
MSSNTSDYIYPIIVPSDFDVEDAFSSDDALHLHLFPYSLQDRAAEWFDRLPRNSINS